MSRSKSRDSTSATLFNEILHNETAKDVLNKDKSILKDVISAIKKENDNYNTSASQLPASVQPVVVKSEVKALPENKLKKPGVLDLPMPPEFKLEPDLQVKKSELHTKDQKVLKMHKN